MTNITLSGIHDNATLGSFMTCDKGEFASFAREERIMQYVCLALGVPGNLLSAIIWLRRNVVGKNSSAVYLSTLAVNDLAYLLGVLFIMFSCVRNSWSCVPLLYVTNVARLLEPLLVLGFSIERLVAILRPLQVCYASDRRESTKYM